MLIDFRHFYSVSDDDLSDASDVSTVYSSGSSATETDVVPAADSSEDDDSSID